MRELVRLAEVREARAKQEVAALLAERAGAFDTETARGERRQPGLQVAVEPGEAPAAQQLGHSGQDGDAAAEEQRGRQREDGQGAHQPAAAGETSTGQGWSSAGDGMRGGDLGSATAEALPACQCTAGADSPAAAVGAAAGEPEAGVERLLREKQLAIAEARRRKAAAHGKFSKLSQVCVAADQVSTAAAAKKREGHNNKHAEWINQHVMN